MSWAVEEYAEDAVRAYLASKIVSTAANFYTAWTAEEIKYPCVVVHAGQSRNVEGLAFTGQREIDVQIAVMCEAVAKGAVSARNSNRSLRTLVVEALAHDNLPDLFNAMMPDGVVFSMAFVANVNRSVEPERRVFVSEITLSTIASPKEFV